MNCFLFSGGDETDNEVINQRLLDVALSTGKKKKDIQITFIPADHYFAEVCYVDFAKYWKKKGISKIYFYPLYEDKSHLYQEIALESDIIFLGGGNTYYFLWCLRKIKLLNKLKSFVRSGGVLAGLSAGAIMMSPDIRTAGFPDFDKDENYVGIKNLRSLGITSFDFFPHYRNSKRYNDELLKQSRKQQVPIYAAYDGSGIIIQDQIMQFVGKVKAFHKGESFWNGPVRPKLKSRTLITLR